MSTRWLKALLCIVLAAAIWPVFLALKSPESKAQSGDFLGISVSGGTIVPIVIAASFTRITDNDNKLVLTVEDPVSTRDNIFALISSKPGIHFRELCRTLDREIGVIQYHCGILKKFGLVTSERDGRFTRFYVKSAKFDDTARNILASWQRPVEKQILSKLATEGVQPGFMKSIMAGCGVTSQAITWHINRLKANGLIESNELSQSALVPAVREKMAVLARQGIIQLAG